MGLSGGGGAAGGGGGAGGGGNNTDRESYMKRSGSPDGSGYPRDAPTAATPANTCRDRKWNKWKLYTTNVINYTTTATINLDVGRSE
ncbi:hypothetical protein HDU76_005758 [Blyttiomyces sp. JEL0837]|nr:hypothetical protein HDU76_005758 [Blyttiomyces sp. JEL0837]